jgi:hypothetical protein
VRPPHLHALNSRQGRFLSPQFAQDVSGYLKPVNEGLSLPSLKLILLRLVPGSFLLMKRQAAEVIPVFTGNLP